MKTYLFGRPTEVRMPKDLTVQDLKALTKFKRIIKGYLKMERILKEEKL